MKLKLLLVIFSLGLLLPSDAQQCSDIEIQLFTQASIDNFSTNYPNCNQTQQLTIEGSDITNLFGLQALTRCGDINIINTPNLISLEGLHELQHAVILTVQNTGITDLEGLRNLDTVEFLMAISANDQLADLSGLEELETVLGMHISDNQRLESLNGLTSLKEVELLSVEYNPLLEDLTGMPALQHVEGLFISHNDGLQNLAGLEQIVILERDLVVLQNPNLVSLQGLSALTMVERDILIDNNLSLVNLQGLNQLEAVGRDLQVVGSYGLQSLSGLNALRTVGNALRLSENPNLVDLTSLNNLRTIYGLLHIGQHARLESLSGIDFVTSIGDLDLTFNNELTACSVTSICNHLQNGGSAVVGGNAGGCATTTQILEDCLVAADDVSVSAVSIYPNPVNSVLRIEGVSDPGAVITLYDSHGRVCQGVKFLHSEMDLTPLAPGWYYMEIKTDDGVDSRPVIKI